VYPVSVNSAGEPSAALALAGLTVPDVQLSDTLTLAPLFGMKSFFTRNLALRRVLVIVHSPALSAAAHVPVES
jgi:hypothetical protein